MGNHKVVRSSRPTVLAWVTVFGLTFAGCSGTQSTEKRSVVPQTQIASSVATDWPTAPLEGRLDPGLIGQCLARIEDGTYKNIHSVLIVQDGKLLVERYFPGRDESGNLEQFRSATPQYMASATKSVNSLLVGIAIDQHLIRDVDQKISAFFPEYVDLFADPKKDTIRVRDCLSMTAGLAWDESTYPYSDPRNDHVAMNASADPVRYVLERPVVSPPGAKFNYNSGVTILLGEIIHKASGVRADKFAERNLFGPLGITDYRWIAYPNGTIQTGGGLWMRPCDMAKIGQLCLDGGRWNGKQIVSPTWIEASIQQHAPDRTYGYQWWLGSLAVDGRQFPVFAAQGRGGQFILVLPDLRIVAVFTGWNEGELGAQPFELMRRYILPAATAPHSGGKATSRAAGQNP